MAKEKITRDMPLAEVVHKYPAAADILMSEGIHCIGCMASHFENLEEGLMAHGKDEKEIIDLLKRMNKAAEKKA
ncbi:DUF1858 domain-containing protein [archaeon]|nr:DUF1858 domain-containing protein [archaeon]MBL7057676.1 DUF1858 domain-containing protein [Candidatus Woesearchaeota archaeon]